MSTNVSSLADAVAQELEAYSQEVTDAIKDEVRAVAKVCKDTIKAGAPVYTGAYKKGWRVKLEHESYHDIRMVVHNATDYQLAHLLEHGHALAAGGRAPAHPHIGPAADRAAELLEKKVKVAVKK